jgi:hypothetical protein
MRACAILLLLLPLGTAEARRQSVVSIARKAGLDGKPSEETTEARETWRHWRNAVGHRWQVLTRDPGGRVVERADGIRLTNGRYSLRWRRGSHVTLGSEWTANGVEFEQITYRASDGSESHRTAGNGILRRVTGTGIGPDGPLRFTTDKDALVPVILEAAPKLAARLRRTFELELNDHLLPVHNGDDVTTLRARARQLDVAYY